MQSVFRIFYNLSTRVYNKLEQKIPGFNTIMEKVQADAAVREARRKERREALRAEKQMALDKRDGFDP